MITIMDDYVTLIEIALIVRSKKGHISFIGVKEMLDEDITSLEKFEQKAKQQGYAIYNKLDKLYYNLYSTEGELIIDIRKKQQSEKVVCVNFDIIDNHIVINNKVLDIYEPSIHEYDVNFAVLNYEDYKDEQHVRMYADRVYNQSYHTPIDDLAIFVYETKRFELEKGKAVLDRLLKWFMCEIYLVATPINDFGKEFILQDQFLKDLYIRLLKGQRLKYHYISSSVLLDNGDKLLGVLRCKIDIQKYEVN